MILIEDLYDDGKLEQAENLLQTMLNKGLIPDAITTNTWIHQLYEENWPKQAARFLMLMVEKGYDPDEIIIDDFVGFLCDEGSFRVWFCVNMAVNMVEFLKGKDIFLDGGTFFLDKGIYLNCSSRKFLMDF